MRRSRLDIVGIGNCIIRRGKYRHPDLGFNRRTGVCEGILHDHEIVGNIDLTRRSELIVQRLDLLFRFRSRSLDFLLFAFR